MLDGAPASLLREWQAFYELEPFGEIRGDLRAANICLTIAQAMGGKKGGGKFKLQDFMLDFDKQPASTDLAPVAAQALMRERYGKKP